MSGYELVTLERDCPGYLVPSGETVKLPEGTEAILVQALGGSYTLNVQGNLIHVDGEEADAFGKAPLAPLETQGLQLGQDEVEALVWDQIRLCYDPEIPVNIVDLGLIYECQVLPAEKHQYFVSITMTLTAPGCGMGPVLCADVERKVRRIAQVSQVHIELVFDPPWSRDVMSEEAKLELGVL